ncbi:MAG: hypothetical protein ACK4I8_01020 [Armatimonadota bacterium]
MMRMWISLALLAGALSAFAFSKTNLSSSDGLFVKMAEVRGKNGHVSEAALLPKGEVIYFWERTRPPTEEEKKLRAKWFDEQ